LLNVKPGDIYAYQFSLNCTNIDADGRVGGFAERCRWHTAAAAAAAAAAAVAFLQCSQAALCRTKRSAATCYAELIWL